MNNTTATEMQVFDDRSATRECAVAFRIRPHQWGVFISHPNDTRTMISTQCSKSEALALAEDMQNRIYRKGPYRRR
jgi:hypothetical protein